MTSNEIVPFSAPPMFDPVRMNPVNMPLPMVTETVSPIMKKSAGTLHKFLQKMFKKPFGNRKLGSQYITTISFGKPELVEDETDIISEQMKMMTDEEPKLSTEERSSEFEGQKPLNATADVSTKVNGQVEEPEEQESVEEVEVNIVKTVLPDDTYLI